MEELLNKVLEELKKLNEEREDIYKRLNALEGRAKVLSTREAAEMMGVTTKTIYNWHDQGRIHRVVVNGKRGYLSSELVRLA